MKKILGLDLGTNSIGWALIEIDHKDGIVRILGLGSRILPMDAGEIGDFESKGKIESAAAARTAKRGPRRMNERYKLRRDRLHLVLDLLDALPPHYKLEIDFERNGQKCGQFKLNKEPKVAFVPLATNPKKKHFIFEAAFEAMLQDFGVLNKKGCRIPRDWTLYYLRQKALKEEISLEELTWVLLSYNQKRGYEKLDVEDVSTKDGEFIEELDLQVAHVEPKTDKEGKQYFELQLSGNDKFIFKEYSNKQLTFKDDLKEIVKISKVDEQGNIDPKKTEFKITDIYPLIIKQVVHQNEKGKHSYTLTYDNGWVETKEASKYTFKYRDATGKPFDYVIETVYDGSGNIKTAQGKDRKLREPDFSDKSNDWTLLKKRTEKEALKFNVEQGYLNNDGSAKNYISPKIYNVLRDDTKTGSRTKIIGGLFQVVERKFYREELRQIIATQRKFHSKLNDTSAFEQCVRVLYPKNDAHAKSLLGNKDAIEHLLVEDILLYQRPLKTKKSEISNCKYEIKSIKETVDEKTGEIRKEPIYLKVVSASHPYFQEFRIWDKLHSLRLIQLEREIGGKLSTNVDVTKEYFDQIVYQELFAILNNQKTMTQKQFSSFCKSKFKIKDIENFVWNFPDDEELKGNETRVHLATRFKRCGFKEYADFLTQERELKLWHYLYSVNYKERTEDDLKSIKSFFGKFLKDSGVSDEVRRKLVEDFANYPKFASKYCAYSEKALKKLLPFLRMGENRFVGKFDLTQHEADLKRIDFDRKQVPTFLGLDDESKDRTKEERINVELQKQTLHDALWRHSINQRIEEILSRLKKIDFSAKEVDYSPVVWNSNDPKNGELSFPKGLFNAFKGCSSTDDFTSLDLTKASYLVYGRHSELAEAKYWTSPDIIREELHHELKQHSLNNPVAEKVILEMMQVVADIWDYYGKDIENFFSEIHLEVGRELKRSAKQKLSASKSQGENRKQNKRLRMVLEEFLINDTYKARPKNSEHLDRLKIAEDGARIQLNDKDHLKGKSYSKKEIEEILNKPRFSKEDFDKYKLWIEQGYRSPYTGITISLTNLFDRSKYNIDHVFPQASVTNDSLNNKVVCETEVNKLKSNQTGRAFVNNPGQRMQFCAAHGKAVEIINDAQYVAIVKSLFTGSKKHILLSKEIPKEFTNSQLNNTRHIARKAMELLSHIVREEGEVEFMSKNVLPVTGAVTGKLKEAWRLDEVWKELVAPRYKRMNELTDSSLFGQERKAKSGHIYFDCNLDEAIREKDQSYDIKRIDHRHHALDALIIALCTRDHVKYINNVNADVSSDDFGKQKQLEAHRATLKRKIKFTEKNNETDDKNWSYMLPGQVRKEGDQTSSKEAVLVKSYAFKDGALSQGDYKKMVLTALQHTVVTFKQNMRVVNMTVNRYNNTPDNKKFAKQDNKKAKYNWAIRRSLGKDTFYGKKEIDGEQKIISRKALDATFGREKILKITDNVAQTILINHLKQFDTVELPFDEAMGYYNALVEKAEFESIVQNQENGFSDLPVLVDHLKTNDYRFNKVDYSKVNVFIDQVEGRDFRNERQFTNQIQENPDLAFTPEQIDRMNQPEELFRLNSGKRHMPIRKVKVASGFGKQRAVSEDENSVKSKQYVVADAGSNLYLGFYQRTYSDKNGNEVTERKFEDIGLLDLISTLKQDKNNRYNPLPEKIYDKEKNEFKRVFTLSPLELVYVPTKDEIENPELVNETELTKEQLERVYKFVDGGEDYAKFVPYGVSSPIWKFHGKEKKGEIHKLLSTNNKIEIELKKLIQDEFGRGSQETKSQNTIDEETLIKKVCWKLEVDRLGNITKAVR